VSGLETLPPDQRAVLQLILRQGRGYAELAGLLKIDRAAVRSRAQAGIEALGAGAGEQPGAEQRAQIADYLLGQQDDGERIVTLAELGESASAARWAQALRTQLAPLAHAPLPEVPAPALAATNGATAVPQPALAVVAAAPPAAPPPPPAAAPEPAAAAPEPAPAARSAAPARPAGPPRPSSRLGGAILLAGVAAAIAVLAIVLIANGGGSDKPSTAASTSTPQSTPTSTPSTTTTPVQAAPLAQVNLKATPAGGQAVGIGFVQRQSGKLTLAMEAQKLPANGAQDIYAAWLQGSPGSKFLGFVPQQVKAGGTFTVSAPLPANARSYANVLITRESTAATPTTPGPTILSGTPVWRK
jgi:Sigma-70, region 4